MLDQHSQYILDLIKSIEERKGDRESDKHDALELARVGHMNIQLLLNALRNPRPKVRQNVCFALGEMGDVRALPMFMKLLSWESMIPVRSEVIEALVKIEGKTPGSVKLDEVRNALQDSLGFFANKESAEKGAIEEYIRLTKGLANVKIKIDMPELPAKIKPPKRTFRQRRVVYA